MLTLMDATKFICLNKGEPASHDSSLTSSVMDVGHAAERGSSGKQAGAQVTGASGACWLCKLGPAPQPLCASTGPNAQSHLPHGAG